MFNTITILPGTNNVQHTVQGVQVPSTTNTTIINRGSNVWTSTNNILIKNK